MSEAIGQTTTEPIRPMWVFVVMWFAEFISRLERMGGGLVK